MIVLTKYADYVKATTQEKSTITTNLRAKTEDVRMLYMTRSEFLNGGKDIKGTQVCVVPDGYTPEQAITKLTEAQEPVEAKAETIEVLKG